MLRYGAQTLLQGNVSPSLFPYATFGVNIIGSFLIGLFSVLSARFGWSEETRFFLTTGLCGGFTTFSTFSHEGMNLLKNGNYGIFFFYLVSSLLIGIATAFAGNRTGLWFAGK